MAIFINGSDLCTASSSFDFDIDYKLLRQEFMRGGKLLRAFLINTATEPPLVSAALYSYTLVLPNLMHNFCAQDRYQDAGVRVLIFMLGTFFAKSAARRISA